MNQGYQSSKEIEKVFVDILLPLLSLLSDRAKYRNSVLGWKICISPFVRCALSVFWTRQLEALTHVLLDAKAEIVIIVFFIFIINIYILSSS